MTGPASESLTADVDGNNMSDTVRSFAQERAIGFPRFYAVLQVQFDHGGLSAPFETESTQLFGAKDLDGDRRSEIFIALDGNTAQPGTVVTLRDCELRFIDGRYEDGVRRFSYLIAATGLGCRAMCYVGVFCQRTNARTELVLYNAEARPVGDPAVTAATAYSWNLERWVLDSGTMMLIERRQGQTTHAQLPVPTTQGFTCT